MSLRVDDCHKTAFTKAVRTGVLNLGQQGLKALPRAVFEIEKYVPENNGWWELLVPRCLVLVHNELSDLAAPQDLCWSTGWKELEALNVAYNALSEIPDEIMGLEMLRKLQCHNNELRRLDLSCASNLNHIELQNNRLQSLGENIGGSLPHLEHLNVSNNELRSLPQSLLECCPKLQVLEAANNAIAGDLGNIDFSRCQRLKECDLSNNRLTAIPRSILAVPSLLRLALRRNRIAAITEGDGDGDECRIVDLYLGCNRLSEFPWSGSLKFPSLKLLDLSSNALDAVSTQIATSCPALHRLDVSGNNLNDLPPTLATIESLECIVATGNPLRRIKRSVIGDARMLKQFLRSRLPPDTLPQDQQNQGPLGATDTVNLNQKECKLNGHRLRALPPTIDKMTNLCHLEIDNNAIPDIHELADCKLLRHLSAQKNLISDISALFDLENLEEIDLRANRLSLFNGAATKPNGIWPKLQNLRLAFNRIADVSPLLQSIASPTVRILDCGNNNLSRFPLPVLRWKVLQILDLSNNDLSDIPNELGLMETLNALLLDGNRLRKMRSVINRGNTLQILLWLRNRIPAK